MSPRARPLLAVALMFTIPILLSALLTPHIFNGLRLLGEHTDALPKLTEARFERVASRCAMIVAALILYPIIKMTGLLPRIREGLRGSRERRRELAGSVAIGCGSIAVLYAIGYALNAYTFEAGATAAGPLVMKFLEYLIGSVIIGFFEEVFFRAFVFDGLRHRLGFVAALVTSSVIFSSIHFFRPLYPTVIEHASWSTGFSILPYMFNRFNPDRDMVFAITLFVIGLTLGTYYHKRGSLYFIAGLHGGWVLAMRMAGHLFDRNWEVYPRLFGASDIISKGWIALVVVSMFLIAALLEKPRPSPSR